MTWQKTKRKRRAGWAALSQLRNCSPRREPKSWKSSAGSNRNGFAQLLKAYAGDSAIQAELKKFRDLAAKKGPVLFIGMGASYCSSISGSVLLQSHGRPGFSVDAGEWLHYASSVWDDAALSILLTTSGESAELVELFKRGGDRALGLICNNPASTCWHLAENKLPILAGPEYGNATKTYTNATAAAIIVASEIVGRPWKQEAERAAEVFSAHLDPIFAMRGDLEMFCRGAANIEVIGRGAAYGGAFMSALCIREMSGTRAAAHTGAGFKHGPNLDVDATHVAIIFALGRTAELGVKLAQECNRRGGKVVLVSSEEQNATGQIVSGQDRGSSRTMGGHHLPAGPAGADAGDGRADRMPASPALSIRRYGTVVRVRVAGSGWGSDQKS